MTCDLGRVENSIGNRLGRKRESSVHVAISNHVARLLETQQTRKPIPSTFGSWGLLEGFSRDFSRDFPRDFPSRHWKSPKTPHGLTHHVYMCVLPSVLALHPSLFNLASPLTKSVIFGKCASIRHWLIYSLAQITRGPGIKIYPPAKIVDALCAHHPTTRSLPLYC
jgi:hypothetical protein